MFLVLRLPRLGEERANLSTFRTFVRFEVREGVFGFVSFLFLLGVWEGLRFVIVALPGLFPYLFLRLTIDGCTRVHPLCIFLLF